MIYKLSVDQEVKIKLTPTGKAVFQGMLTTVVKKDPQEHVVRIKTDKDGYITMSLWQLMTYFGGMLSHGAMLEDNSIFLEVK